VGGEEKEWVGGFFRCSAQGRKDSSAWTGSAWSVRMKGSDGKREAESRRSGIMQKVIA
jgi:hypothetical protein